jgi:hypothetical protein
MRWLLAPTESRIRGQSKRFLAGKRCAYISDRKHLRRAQLPRNDCPTLARYRKCIPKDRGWLLPASEPQRDTARL